MSSERPERQEFHGKIIQRDADGYGVVEFSSPETLTHSTGFFTREVLQNPQIERTCKVGTEVTGRVQVNSNTIRVLRLEPAGW